ncbi:MAG: AMP-binding protein, partial [bacterium]|nr:AMP-binding protein [bacterium]
NQKSNDPKSNNHPSSSFPNNQYTITNNETDGPIVLNLEHLLLEDLESGSVPEIEFSASDLPTRPSAVTYIIYTSGTTGKPRGVMVEHRHVVRLLFNDKKPFEFNSDDVWTLFHSLCFDFSVWEMYGALLYGGKLVIVPAMVVREPARCLELLKKHKVTVLNQTPSAFYNLAAEEAKQKSKELTIKVIVFGGEALSPIKLKQWKSRYPGTPLINMFGITETTVHVTYKEITSKEIETNTGNIGKPIPTLSAYILNKNRAMVPKGVPGELYVGGMGVSRGYMNNPELTAQRYPKKSPLVNVLRGERGHRECRGGSPSGKTPEARLYQSGDLVRMLPGDEMEYLGRVDHQVQLRGFRIELGEIETRILKHETIKNAVVRQGSTESGDAFLCAYIVLKKPGQERGNMDTAALREYLAQGLPHYMIPSYIVPLEKIPLTSNGKVDGRALPEPGVTLEGQYTAPRSREEIRMATVWQGALKLERIGIEDNFFIAGGDSIKAIRLINAVNAEFDTNLTIPDLYGNDTIETLAKRVGTQPGVPGKYGDIDKEIKKAAAEIETRKTGIMDTVNSPDANGAIYP